MKINRRRSETGHIYVEGVYGVAIVCLVYTGLIKLYENYHWSWLTQLVAAIAAVLAMAIYIGISTWLLYRREQAARLVVTTDPAKDHTSER